MALPLDLSHSPPGLELPKWNWPTLLVKIPAEKNGTNGYFEASWALPSVALLLDHGRCLVVFCVSRALMHLKTHTPWARPRPPGPVSRPLDLSSDSWSLDDGRCIVVFCVGRAMMHLKAQDYSSRTLRRSRKSYGRCFVSELVTENWQLWHVHCLFDTGDTQLHCVSKNDTDVAHYNFEADQPILINYGGDFADRVCYQIVICYPTSPN